MPNDPAPWCGPHIKVHLLRADLVVDVEQMQGEDPAPPILH